ncbi:MAG TPA: hypothetical protein VFL62_11520 [Bradyrhizobium sp.]|uniref:hypothetical protein n=1 Tax=Bradyrhizobium sp. TaxID=376 RepID=UPI002D7EAC04|nr:hypothetical protein [Bradyrhizobium sp.]HET7886847.1 hypothetical protein [Bradyrhizobium sp.]
MARLRFLVTALLVLAFALGPGWTACVASQHGRSVFLASPDAATSHRSHDHHAHAAAGHIVLATLDAVPGKAHQSGHDDGTCLKCCAGCIPISILPPSNVVTVPTGARSVFAAIDAQAPGRIVFVDPDIPKRVA